MSITKVLSGLQPWDKTEYNSIGLTDDYIDMVNDANQGYRDYVLSKLNLNSPMTLHGGSIKVEFGETINKLPMDKIISLVEAYGEDYVTNQLGGGFIDWIKSIFGKRDFDAFKARYDKLRDELDKKIVRFEVETRGMKADTEVNAKYMKALLLNKKMKTMMEIMVDTNMKSERKKYIMNLISLANVKEQQILVSINEYNKIVAEKNKANRPYFFGLLGKKKSFFDKLSADYDKTAKEFNEVFKYFSELINQTLEMQSLKAKYGSLTPDIKSKLAKSQVKEFEHWEKNREKYEKIEAFTESHMEEANKLVQKQAELNMLIHDYNLAFGTLGKQRTSAEDILKDWDTKIRSVYFKITQCVELGNKYFGILDAANQLIVNNSNLITSLSLAAMEPVLKEYETHITSVDYTSNLMKKLVGTLGEIKNNFIKLVPSQNLQADILYVGATRTYLLTLIENIKRRQINFSGGEKYLRDVVKGKVRGGAILNQDGGMYLAQPGFDTYPLYFLHTDPKNIVRQLPYNPNNNATFAEYAKTGVPIISLNATGAGKNIIDVPYGTILYDTPNPAGTKTDIAGEYEKWIKITDAKDTMILPIIDFDAEVIKIYEITYTDISDLSALDISADLLKDINITARNKQQFISYKDSNGHEYFIYNIYADNADELIIKGVGKVKYYVPLLLQNTNYAILPIFSKIRTRKDMIEYDEYHLLNPLTGLPIMTIVTPDNTHKTMEFDFQTQTDVDAMDNNFSNGRTMYYHFNAVGIKYDIADATKLTMDYGAGAGPELFKLRNAELAKLPDVIDYHWGVMYQLTMILNNIFNRCLSPKTTIDTTKVNFDILNTRNINSVIYQVGIGNIDDDDHTKLELKVMNLDTFAVQFFGGDPRSAVIIIRKIINKELADDTGNLLFNPSVSGPRKTPTTDPATLLGVVVPKADSLSPKQRQAMDYILRSIPKTSPYWTNQTKILGMIEEFFKPEYRDKFELELHDIQNLVYDIRGIEQGILKINVNITNKDELPKYSLITEEMEVKPNDLKLGEIGDTITNAGKDLRSLVQNSSEFASKFAAELGVNESNIITLLEADNFLISTFTPGSKQTFADWVRNPAYPDRIKILDYLGNVDLAKKLYDQLLKHSVYAIHAGVICERLTADGGIDKYNAKDAYIFLKGHAKGGKHDEKPKPQQPGQTVALTFNPGAPTTNPARKPPGGHTNPAGKPAPKAGKSHPKTHR